MDRGVISDIELRTPAGRLIVGVFVVILVLFGAAFIFPFLFAFTAGLKTSTEIFKPGLHLWPENPNWGNYLEAWNRFNMVNMFKNTAIAAIGGAIGQLIVSALAAFSLSRLKPAGKRVIEAILLITLAIPGVAYLVPRYVILANLPIINVSLINQFAGLWIPYAANAMTILILKNSFDQIPKDLYEAAAVDGASDLRMFVSFTLPLSTPILIILGLLGFIGFWGDYLLPLLILRDPALQTISVRLISLTRIFGANLHLAASFIAMLPPAIAAIFLQRYIRGGISF
ncbi:MAG: carbohydrate ABC transporter permease [Anaerolineales bacterium]|nr:carbohydrate ABC transporter permease [Anaerolineales bacterium]